MPYTLQNITAAMNRRGYAVFSEGDYNLNIVGVRSADRRAGRYDDAITLFYRVNGDWSFNVFGATTDPGSFYLREPLPGARRRGTAILKEGQYRGTYIIDEHRGLYDALCQRAGDVTVYRDNNRDDNLDLNTATQETGRFGINIHKSNRDDDPLIGSASAGCQVLRDHEQFTFLMNVCERARERWGNRFTYTLLNSSDVL